MSDILKVAALQLDIVAGVPADNLAETERLIKSLPDGYDIAILPEMFTTGFNCSPQFAASNSEPMDGLTITTIKRLASERKIAITGSFVARDNDGAIYNRAFFIEPSGDISIYDKHHLFSVSGESDAYSRGTTQSPIIRFRGWNIALAVCYDLRFPAWLRNHDGAYDLLIVMASWPDARAYPWKHLLIARAIENQAYVAGCNRSGSDQYGLYSGLSMVVDAKGQPISTPTGQSIVCAELSKSDLTKFRNKFQVLGDADRYKFL